MSKKKYFLLSVFLILFAVSIFANKGMAQWNIETLANGDFQHTSIAIDSSGYVHISYYNYRWKDLNYMTNASGS